MAGFTKLFSEIVTSSIWSEDDKTRLVWITMLALKDKNGFVAAAIPGLANAARVSLESCEAAVKKLEAADKYSRTKTDDGRRIKSVDGGWMVVNHFKFRNQGKSDDERAKTRERVRKFREKRCNDVTPLHAVTPPCNAPDTDTEADSSTGKRKKGTALPGQIDYSKTKPPEIRDYGDIENPLNDPILVAIGVIGESGKMGWGHWLKKLNRARKTLGCERAERLFRGCLKELYGEIRQGECRKAGAIFNLKLRKVFG